MANDERKEILNQINDARASLNVINMKVFENHNPKQQNSQVLSLASDSKNTFISSTTKSAQTIKEGISKEFSDDFK